MHRLTANTSKRIAAKCLDRFLMGRRVGETTSQQDNIIKAFENEVRKRGENAEIDWKESNRPESRGFLFGDFRGITLTVSPGGLMNIPAVRSIVSGLNQEHA